MGRNCRAIDLSSGVKTCPKCGQEKPLSEFYRRKPTRRDPTGYRTWCKPCETADGMVRVRKWRSDPEKWAREKATGRVRSKTPERRAKHAAYMREYTKRPSQRPILADRWRIKNARLRAEAYVDGVAQQVLEIEGKFTRADWLALVKEFDQSCAYCHEKAKLTLEHLTPLSREGKTEVGNVVPACQPCNSSKGDQTVEEYLPQRAAEIRQKAVVH